MQEMVARVHEDHVTQTRSVERVQRRVHGHRITIDRALQQTQLALQEQSAVLTKHELLVKVGRSIHDEKGMMIVSGNINSTWN